MDSDFDAPAGPLIRWLGRQPHAEMYDAMRRFTAARGADTPDELWLVEHDPVYTLGQAGRPTDVLDAAGVKKKKKKKK